MPDFNEIENRGNPHARRCQFMPDFNEIENRGNPHKIRQNAA